MPVLLYGFLRQYVNTGSLLFPNACCQPMQHPDNSCMYSLRSCAFYDTTANYKFPYLFYFVASIYFMTTKPLLQTYRNKASTIV